MTTPLPVTSVGGCLVQGLARSGKRTVAKIFTTEFSTVQDRVPACSAGTAADSPLAASESRLAAQLLFPEAANEPARSRAATIGWQREQATLGCSRTAVPFWFRSSRPAFIRFLAS